MIIVTKHNKTKLDQLGIIVLSCQPELNDSFLVLECWYAVYFLPPESQMN